MRFSRHWLLLIALTSSLSGCHENSNSVATTVAAHDAALRELPRDFYRPGLGDQMNALQERHAKLWYAGDAANWPLAAFELEELQETLERIARWHADNQDVPMGPSIKAYTQEGRYAVSQAIAHRDRGEFARSFDRFTAGCNDCHRAAKHEFIVIQRPTTPPVSNQRWQPEER
jgi:hypothetical protein